MIRGRRPGFTLIELAAVVVVVAILAGVAASTMAASAGARSAAAARRLLRDLTFARQRAVATGTRTWVVFDTAAGTWSLLEEDPADPGRAGASAITDPLSGRPMVETLGAGTWAGVALQSAAFDAGAEVGFDWLGRPLNATGSDLAATGTAVLSGGRQVSVTAGTGHVYAGP